MTVPRAALACAGLLVLALAFLAHLSPVVAVLADRLAFCS